MEETIRDAWEPIQLWPDLVLPCDKPQVTYITQTVLRAPQVTQVTQASQASSGPSTSTGGPGNVSQDKLMQLLSLHKQTAKVLQELGLDPGTTQVEESTSDAIPIPLDSSVCPVCNKQMSSHYRAVLHYRYRHLHRTKWYCQICNKYFTSQANLDEHEYTKHGDTQFSCYICEFTSEHKRHLKTHLKSHKRYKIAKSDGLICEYCLHRKLDVQGHQKHVYIIQIGICRGMLAETHLAPVTLTCSSIAITMKRRSASTGQLNCIYDKQAIVLVVDNVVQWSSTP